MISSATLIQYSLIEFVLKTLKNLNFNSKIFLQKRFPGYSVYSRDNTPDCEPFLLELLFVVELLHI